MSSSLYGDYACTPTLKRIFYGPGCLNTALPRLLEILQVKKALIVTGNTLRTKTDVVEKVEATLKEHNAFGGIFHDIRQHVPVAGINGGVQAFKDHGADFIVSVGGGSPIDASKAILHKIWKERGTAEPPFQVAIPTTLGAAEFTYGAGFTNEAGVKVGVNDPLLAPAGVILDASLTLATPERLWLSTGIRAVDHCVENLTRNLFPLPLKPLCYAALADLFKYLPISKAEPQNVEVRQRLQLAAFMSLWPLRQDKFTVLGLSHILGHRLGAAYNIGHGITSCITLPAVLALQAEIATPEFKECLAECLFYLREPSTGSVEGDIRKLSELVAQLINNLGLKSTMSEYKVPREDIPKLAGSSEDPNFPKIVKVLESVY